MKMDFKWESVNGLARALGGRVELLEKVFKEKGLTPAMIHKIVASGFASDFFDIGDEIMTTYTATNGTVYDFPWRVVDFRDVYWENDPEPHPGMVLQAKYLTFEPVPFDDIERNIVPDTETEAEEGWYYFGMNGTSTNKSVELELKPGDTIPHGEYEVIYKNGVNVKNSYNAGLSDWKNSSLRQWLNSNAEVGNWWSSTHLGDVISSKADVYNGFMHGFESDFLDFVKATRISSWTDIAFENERDSDITYTYDKFFIASAEELYSKVSGLPDPEGTKAFEYFVKFSGVSNPTFAPLAIRCFKSLDAPGTNCAYITRSFNRKFSGYNFNVNALGSLDTMTTTAFNGFVLPCCVIS